MYKIRNWLVDNSACGLYRALNPTKNCKEELLKSNIELDCSTNLSLDEKYDCIIGHRIPPLVKLPFFLKLKSSGVKIIWEVDDDLVNIPEWSPFKFQFNNDQLAFLDMYFRMANAIIVSTDHLKEMVAKTHELDPNKIFVLKNLIDLDDWKLLFHRGENGTFYSKEVRRCNVPFQVIWSGSESHIKDLDELGSLVEQFKDNDDIFFTMQGYIPPQYLPIPPNKLVHVRWGNCKHYPNTLSLLAPHVALLPLQDHIFNKSKSNIKYLEMTLGGAACISSNICTYVDFFHELEEGYIARSPEDWTRWINMLMHDEPERQRVVKSARQLVVDEYTWQTENKNRIAWVDFFKMIPDIKGSEG